MMEAIIPPFVIPRLGVAEQTFVRRSVDVLLTLMSIYGFEKEGFSVKSTYDHWTYCSALVGSPVKFLKYKLACFYVSNKAKLTGEVLDLPKDITFGIDNPSILFGGKGYRWTRILERKDPKLFDSFITSVLYSKKGMPRPGKLLLKKAELDAFKLLTTKMPIPVKQISLVRQWADYSKSTRIKYDEILDVVSFDHQIDRTVKELFKDAKYTDAQRMKPFVPSTSADYINNRDQAGALGLVVGHPHLLDGLRTSTPLITFSNIGNKNKPQVNIDQLQTHFSALYQRIVDEAVIEKPLAVPLALSEPLKTRVITKGPGYTYTALKPLQKFLWSTLKDHKCFELISTPITSDNLQEAIGCSLKNGEKFLSVDYADATNQMLSFASDCVVDALIRHVDLTEQEALLLRKAMTEHLIQNPHDKREILPQVRGQLMGSVVSFPILCIINATILRWAYEIQHLKSVPLKNVPMTVNGDDAVIRLNQKGYEAWLTIAEFCGLQASVGKVYFSKYFLNMNSTTFNFHPLGWEGYQTKSRYKTSHVIVNRIRYFELVKYVNLGLLFGLKRSGKGEKASIVDETINDNISSRATKLIQDCPSNLQKRVLCQYIHINKKFLTSHHIPWFIPRQLGGLGLPCVDSYTPAKLDLRLARLIYDHPDVLKIPQLPMNTLWKIWQTAQRAYPYHVYPTTDFTDLSYDTLWGYACVELLFTKPSIRSYFDGGQISDLKKSLSVSTSQRSESIRYFRNLEVLWKKALKSGIPIPEPFNALPTIYKPSQLLTLHISQSYSIVPRDTTIPVMTVHKSGEFSEEGNFLMTRFIGLY